VVKVAAVRVIPVRLRFAQPLRTAQGEFAERVSVVLEVRDAGGAAGYGEAAPWPGFGTESVDEAEASLRAVERLLPGASLQPGEWPAALENLLSGRSAARTALQGALLDLDARRAGRPLSAHLSVHAGSTCGAPLSRVPVNALLTARDPEALFREAVLAREAGYRAVKIKLGGEAVANDLARLQAVRDGIGPSVRLRGDANGAWSVRDALAALEAFARFGLEYVEQPVAAHDIDGMAELRRHAAVQVAADESVASEHGMLRLLAAGAADVVVLKPAALGGAVRALELASLARQSGMRVVFTHAFESAIGARHALHCAAAWGDADGIHGLATAGLFEADVAEPPGCHSGSVAVPAGSGLGVTL
jgi:o-succinylbenzoate synthase